MNDKEIIFVQKPYFMEIENIIFDFGGVIIDIDPELTINAFKKLGYTEIEKLKSQEFYQSVILKFEKGIVSPEVFRDKLRAFLNMDLSDLQLDDSWNALLFDIPRERIELMEEVKKHYPIYLLSNSNSIHHKLFIKDLQLHYGYRDFDELFNKAYFSFELHMNKPNTNIYEFVMDQHGMAPETTLFIDDRPDNIKGAQKVGLKTYHLKTGESIRNLFDKGILKKTLEIT